MVAAPKISAHHHHDAAGIVREVERECHARGLRLTPLRREVLVLVAKARKPVKAYDLLESLRGSHPGAAPPTVYRALDFLLANGFIHKLESINAFVFCQHPAKAHQVPFLICDICESATEVCDEGAIARLIEQQAQGFGFRAKAQTLEVHGVCKACGHA
ncbi:MAG TPA: transcriptional repressor [Rhodanobacteraceae bacterium]|nr:transcriptional repressor [Rhodanobacteraceae bacterium]